MEVFANRAISNAAPAPYSRSLPTAFHQRLTPSLHLNPTFSPLNGVVSCKSSSLRAAMSEETPGTSRFDRETSSRTKVADDVPPVQTSSSNNSFEEEIRSEDVQIPPFGEFLDNFNLKLDTEDSYSLLLYGSGALVSVWLLSAIIGAIDSIPLFPKLMEVVGLSFTLWFTSRYLIFKENRDELTAKIEEIKKQVVGSEEE